MVRGGALHWPLRIGLMALCAVAPWLAGPWYALAVLLALPMLRALLDAMREYLTARVCVVGGCLCAALLLPAWAQPAIALWGAGLLAMSLMHIPSGLRTMLANALLAIATAMLTLALIAARLDEALIPGLAQAMVDLIDGSRNSAELLLQAYQAGLARLEGGMSQSPAVQFFNLFVYIPSDVRVQLLYSLRASLEALLQSYLPQGVISFVMLTALLPALAAEGYLHSRGRASDLPPFTRWYMPRRLATGATVMLLLGLLPSLAPSALITYLGALGSALGSWAWALQGACSLAAMLKARGMQPFTYGLFIALAATAAPIVLFLIGCYDQFRDPRMLRGTHDETI